MDSRTRKPYPSDLTDEQWALVKPILLAYEDRTRPGPERTADLREVTNALLYQNRTGCQWAYLPHDLLPKSTVYDYFTKWRDNWLFQRSSSRLDHLAVAYWDGSLTEQPEPLGEYAGLPEGLLRRQG